MKLEKNKKKLYIIGTIAVVAVVAIVAVVKVVMLNKDKSAVSDIETYDVASIKKVFMDGVVTPVDKEFIYYDATQGEISEVKVEDGNEVKKGDILFTYKNNQVSDQIATLELTNKKLNKTKANAEKELAKAKEAAKSQQEAQGTNALALAAGNAGTASSSTTSYDDEISYNQEQINKLKEKEYKNITAPCDGKVYVGQAKAGSTEPYMTIQSTGYYIKASLGEKDYEKVSTDDKVTVNILATGKETSGTIYFKDGNPESAAGASNSAASLLGATAGQGSTALSSYAIKVSPDEADNLVNGYHVQCVMRLGETEIKVPTTSILSSDNEKYVFVVEDNKTKKVIVETGDVKGEETVIKSGLEGGEKIVKAPTSDMKEGDDIGK